MHLFLRSLGYGRHIVSATLNVTYGNGPYQYVAQQCHMDWSGTEMTCIAPPGVARDLRWSVNLNGFPGILSPPGVVLNYNPPVLYNIISLYNLTHVSPSRGLALFNVTGINFGPAYLHGLLWVHYSPVAHPAIVFDANCTVLEDHYVLSCLTGPQAGNHLYWTINVANQISQVPHTSTALPVVESVVILEVGLGTHVNASGATVGAVDIRGAGTTPAANTTLGLSTTGGGIVLLRGLYVSARVCCSCVLARASCITCVPPLPPPHTHTPCRNFGPDLPNMGLQVYASPTRPMPLSPAQYYTTQYGDATGLYLNEGPAGVYPDVFQCPACAVTVPHFEITCVMPAGYGGLLQWQVLVLDLMSDPFRSATVLPCACLCHP